LVSTSFTSRSAYEHGSSSSNHGASVHPYDSLNLALHVGDDTNVVLQNRKSLKEQLSTASGLPHIAPMFMNQTHGANVFVVDGVTDIEPSADALITQMPDIALCVLVADCIPLLMWDQQVNVIAAVHVGRRGLLNGISTKVVELMRMMGAQQLQAQIGPSICGQCYEVGEDVYSEVVAQHPSTRSQTAFGKLALDLRSGLAELLSTLEVSTEVVAGCTAEDPSLFSFRRDGITGRQAGVIWN
jgi:YfiH family protein